MEKNNKKDIRKRVMSSLDFFLNNEGREAENLLDRIINYYTVHTKNVFALAAIGKDIIINIPIEHIWSLLKLPKLISDTDFQKRLLENENLWKFLEKSADKLPQIGKILSRSGFAMFQDGQLLDQEALGFIKEILKNTNSLTAIKNIALEALKPSSPDPSREPSPLHRDLKKIIPLGLKMVEGDENIQKFLAKYIKNNSTAISTDDAIRSMNNILGKKREVYNNLEEILQKKPKNKKDPKFQDALALVISKSYTFSSEDHRPVFNKELFDEALAEFKQSKRFAKLSKNDQELIENFAMEAATSAKPMVLDYLDQYKVSPKILEHVTLILTKMNEINDIYASLQKDSLFVWVGKSLDMFINDPVLKEFIIKNPTFIPDLAKGVIEATPFLKKLMGNMKFDNQIFDILGVVLVKPEIAANIIRDINGGDYTKLTETLIDALNDPDIPGFKALLKAQAEKGLFNNLIKGILDQNEKSTKEQNDKLILENQDPSGISLKNQLQNYGIDPEKDLEKIAKILPILLDSPEDLRKIFGSFQKGDYKEMVKDLLVMSQSKDAVQQYLSENQDIFVNVLNKVFEQTDKLKDLGLKGTLYNIVPDLMNHPSELIDIMDLADTGQYDEVGKKFLALIQGDENIKAYFGKNKDLLQQIIIKVAGVEKYNISNEISDIFTKLLLDERNKPAVEKLLALSQEAQWSNLAKETCRLIEESEDFRECLRNNKDNFAKIFKIAAVNDLTLRSLFAGLDVNSVVGTELIDSILKSPKVIRELIESSEKGYLSVASKAAGVLYSNRELRGALLNAGYNYLSGAGKAEKQEIVNLLTIDFITANQSKDNKLNLTEFIKTILNTERYRAFDTLLELESNKMLFDGVRLQEVDLRNIDFNGNSFVGAQIIAVRFGGAVLKGSSFQGASFMNVSFHGAEIDAATLKTMVESLRKGRCSLEGAKITGDLSNINLSDISLIGADLTGVTGINNTNLARSNLSKVLLPQGIDLASAVNIDKAIFDNGIFTDELHKQQIEKLANFVATKVAEKSQKDGLTMQAQQIESLAEQLKDLAKGDITVAQNIRDILQKTPEAIYDKNFPLDIKQLKHLSDYKNTTSDLLTTIYENRLQPEKIKSVVVANIIADQLSVRLFGENGNNRGQDGVMMRDLLQKVVSAFAKENSGDHYLNQLLQGPQSVLMLDAFEAEIRSNTQYTKTGALITGGIQLRQDAVSENLIYKLKAGMNAYAGESQLTDAQHKAIERMALEVGRELFQKGAEAGGSRAEDTGRIKNLLKDAFCQAKKENPRMNIDELFEGSNSHDLKKNVTNSVRSKTSYTWAGLVSGGIWLSPDSITPELTSSLVKYIAIAKDSITRERNAEPPKQPWTVRVQETKDTGRGR